MWSRAEGGPRKRTNKESECGGWSEKRNGGRSARPCSGRQPPENLYDEDAGMYYFNARWYDSEIERFVTEDPARDGRNWFVYCENNPLIYFDSDGRQTIPICLPRILPLPRVAPIPIPGEILLLPSLPNNLIQSFDGKNLIEAPWDGDWTHAPNGPDMNDPDSNPLGDDWVPDKDSNSKDKTGKHKRFIN